MRHRRNVLTLATICVVIALFVPLITGSYSTMISVLDIDLGVGGIAMGVIILVVAIATALA